MVNNDASVSGKSLLSAMPHLARMGVTEDTKCQAYREFLPMLDAVEYTIYFRVPGMAKWRVDAIITSEALERLDFNVVDAESLVAKNWTVTYMGPAVAMHFSVEDETALNDIRYKRLEELLGTKN